MLDFLSLIKIIMFFGTICLFDPNIKKLEKQEIKLLEKLTKRLAHQLDTQAEQKAVTAEKISLAIGIFEGALANVL